jgi:hypothetical protein
MKKGDVFVQTFILFWFGSLIINLNNQMLGVVTSLFQVVCFLGYCMFPINLAAIIVNILSLHFFINLALCLGATFWSVKCKLIIF